MIQPTRRFVLLLAAGIPAALLPAVVDGRLWIVWVVFAAGALLAGGLDAVFLAFLRDIRVDSKMPATIYAGDSGTLTLDVSAADWGGASRVDAVCDLDPALLPPQPVPSFRPPPSGRRTIEVPLVPLGRGTARAESLWLRFSGPLGLACRVVNKPIGRSTAVLPDIGRVRATALRYFGTREHAVGVKVERYIGDGSEFDSLREYVPGFDAGAIDWKGTARHVRLMVREYRAERNHQVILAFDVGRLMGEPLDGLPKIDHAVNAGLVLGYMCLKTGDRVGLYSFDDRPGAFVQPAGGVRAFPRLQKGAAELAASTGESNYTLAVANLASRLTRRSLVVVFTDFVDSVAAELLVENMDRLARRHLVVFAALRDPALSAIARDRPNGLRELHRSVAASDLEAERALVLRRLAGRGIRCVDAPPRALSMPLLNRYLEIRRRELV